VQVETVVARAVVMAIATRDGGGATVRCLLVIFSVDLFYTIKSKLGGKEGYQWIEWSTILLLEMGHH